MRSIRTALALSLAAAVTLTACGGDDEPESTTPAASPTVNVGRTNEPLSQLLAEIYGQVMENSGVRVGRKDPAPDLDALHAGLEAGTVQFVPDSTVSVLERYGAGDLPTTAEEQLPALSAALPAELTANAVGSATRTQVVVCGPEVVEANSLVTLTDLAEVAADVTIGTTEVFSSSPSFGAAQLDDAYETEFTFTAVGTTDTDVTGALDSGEVDCGVVSSLEPTVVTSGLLPLEDDRSAAPIDSIVPVMQAIAATPQAVAAITQVNSLLTTDVLRALLVKLVSGDESAETVAKAFIASQASGQ